VNETISVMMYMNVYNQRGMSSRWAQAPAQIAPGMAWEGRTAIFRLGGSYPAPQRQTRPTDALHGPEHRISLPTAVSRPNPDYFGLGLRQPGV
jgi:hypothetical protein